MGGGRGKGWRGEVERWVERRGVRGGGGWRGEG